MNYFDILNHIKYKLEDNKKSSGELPFLPDMYLFIGKKEDAYEKIINPVIDGILNQKEPNGEKRFTMPLTVSKFDASKSLEDFERQIRTFHPDPTKINLCIIEDFDKTTFQGQFREVENAICTLISSWNRHKVPNMYQNDSYLIVLIIAEKDPVPCLSYFFNKGLMFYAQ